jgi:sulfur-carrier protein
MQVTVRAFATVRERLGSDRFILDLPPGATLGDVVERLAATRPEAATLKEWLGSGHLRLAHNLVHAAPETELSDGDEVALFPPVSGG